MKFIVTHEFSSFYCRTFKENNLMDSDEFYQLPRPCSFHSLLVVSGLGGLITLSECNTLTVISSRGDQETLTFSD